MPKRLPLGDDFNDDELYDQDEKYRGVRHYKQEKEQEKKQKWNRESYRDSDNDYDERR